MKKKTNSMFYATWNGEFLEGAPVKTLRQMRHLVKRWISEDDPSRAVGTFVIYELHPIERLTKAVTITTEKL